MPGEVSKSAKFITPAARVELFVRVVDSKELIHAAYHHLEYVAARADHKGRR